MPAGYAVGKRRAFSISTRNARRRGSSAGTITMPRARSGSSRGRRIRSRPEGNIKLDRTDPASLRQRELRFQGTVELARAKSARCSGNAFFRHGPRRWRTAAELSVTAMPLEAGRENEKTVEVLSGLPERPSATFRRRATRISGNS